MSFYRVMSTFVDNINGHHFRVGQFIETDQQNWVARFGDILKREQILPNNVDIFKVDTSLEDSPVIEKIVTEQPKVEKGLTRKPLPNKAILGDTSENK
jgi:hypothetical protein